jgi:hypothetical protein
VSAVRYSRALATAISSLALCGLVILSLSAGLVREPWDLMILAPMLYICPIAGVFVSLSFVKNDVDQPAIPVNFTVANFDEPCSAPVVRRTLSRHAIETPPSTFR